jgi:excinuclease UvrABC nuclease subunit
MKCHDSNVYIYCLKDPRNNEIRYVGKAVNLEKRLYGHIHNGKDRNIHKTNWIQSILNEGLEPIIEELEIVSFSKWENREKY